MKFYKRLKQNIVAISLLMVLAYTLHGVVFNNITQHALEFKALVLHQSAFDPRRATLEVLNFLNGKPCAIKSADEQAINFHWDDWIDLSPGDKVLAPYRQSFPHGECDEVLRKFADVNGYWMESHDKKVYRGMADMYCMKEIPRKVILATDDNFVEVPVQSKRRYGLNNTITKDELLEELHSFTDSKTPYKTTPRVPLSREVHVPASDFIFSPEQEIFKLQNKLVNNNITQEEYQYLSFLEYSNRIVDSADRFFKYPWIASDVVSGRSHHLAYPFFKRYIGDRERQSVIHHMVRAWFQFAEANGFASWVNYGSLLGWAYNGVNMPWDTDIDIQLPIVQLDRLGREFNRSLIIENPKLGNAKYFLEISPTYIRQGNGRNFIDGRFIDVNLGLYIDISALSHTTASPPSLFYEDLEPVTADDGHLVTDKIELSAMAVHCKNWNWHSLQELLPIRHTWFEGTSIYIPHNVSRILTRKYGKSSYTTKSHFAKHNYQQDIRMWVPDEICTSAPRVASRFLSSYDHLQLTLEGACNNKILQDEYRINHESAKRHVELNIDVDTSVSYDIEALGDLPITRKDAWEYFNDINERRVSHESWYVIN